MSRLAYTETIKDNLASFAYDEFKHQITVLRHQTGDLINFLDGRGGCFKGRITAIDNRNKWFQAEITGTCRQPPPPPLHLLVAMPRGGKLDSIIQKAVELGVTTITPLITKRTTTRLHKEKQIASRMEHWQKIAVASLKQSNNPYLPGIERPKDLVDLRSEDSHKIFWERIVFHPQADENILWPQTLRLDKNRAVALALGPEGGFSEEEISILQSLDFLPVSLGKRILRLETAVVSALTLVQYFRNHF
jgi:16S rRNA (uracil1498-N3)-methyltransferase